MELIRKVNIWIFLMPLAAIQLYANSAAGRLSPACLTIMIGLSALALLRAEDRISWAQAQKQAMLFAAYALCFFSALYLAGVRANIFGQLSEVLPSNSIPECLCMAIAAAALEEILFRKLFLEWLRRAMCNKTAIFVSSVAFFLCHLSPFPFILISGIFLGSISVRFNSILAAVAIHAWYDFFIFLSRNVSNSKIEIVNSLTLSLILHGGVAFSHYLFIAIFFMLVPFFNSRSKKNSLDSSRKMENDG